MCEWGTHEEIKVKIPADLSCSGKEHWAMMKIDKCIAPIVRALQRDGIDMRGSCCGHEKTLGYIHLQDDRILLIGNAQEYMAKDRFFFFFKLGIKNLIYRFKLWIRVKKNNLIWRLGFIK